MLEHRQGLVGNLGAAHRALVGAGACAFGYNSAVRSRGSGVLLRTLPTALLTSQTSIAPPYGLIHLGGKLGRFAHPVLELALFQNNGHAVVIPSRAWRKRSGEKGVVCAK